MADRISEIRERLSHMKGHPRFEDIQTLLAELDKRDQRIERLRWAVRYRNQMDPAAVLKADDEAAKSKDPSHEG